MQLNIYCHVHVLWPTIYMYIVHPDDPETPSSDAGCELLCKMEIDLRLPPISLIIMRYELPISRQSDVLVSCHIE